MVRSGTTPIRCSRRTSLKESATLPLPPLRVEERDAGEDERPHRGGMLRGEVQRHPAAEGVAEHHHRRAHLPQDGADGLGVGLGTPRPRGAAGTTPKPGRSSASAA